MESVMPCCFNKKLCRFIELAVGWLGIMISIMVIKVFTQQDEVPLQISIYDNIIVIMSASNFLACCIWLVCIRNNNRGLMRIILFWWGIDVCLAIMCICCYFFENPHDFFQNKIFPLIITVYWICSLVISILCFRTKKDADRRAPKGIILVN